MKADAGKVVVISKRQHAVSVERTDELVENRTYKCPSSGCDKQLITDGNWWRHFRKLHKNIVDVDGYFKELNR